MNRISYCFLFLLMTVMSCRPKASGADLQELKPAATAAKFQADTLQNFRRYMGKFKALELPVVLSLDRLQTLDTLPVIAGADTVYTHANGALEDWDKQYAYGLLPDTLQTYKVIVLKPAEVGIPVLITYSKRGQKLSEEELTVGQCGSGPGYECRETARIEKDLTLTLADSVTITPNSKPGQAKHQPEKYVLARHGKITPSGQVVISGLKKM